MEYQVYKLKNLDDGENTEEIKWNLDKETKR